MSDLTQSATTPIRTSGEPLAGPHFSVPQSSRSALRSAPLGPVLLSAQTLRKSYRKGQISIPVLNGVDIQVRQGEFLSVAGKSGSGKSTLLHLLATLDAPDAGQIHFDGQRIDNLSAVRRDRLRNQQMGVVFQFYHLLPELTTLENVLLPAMIGSGLWNYWRRRRSRELVALELLERVGLSHRLRHRPRELSGGEMQRVAIARSLMNRPRILLADEPTGNLDRHTGGQIMQLLQSLNEERQLTIVMVTHDATLAQESHRVMYLVEGRVEG
jgi:lipoprotein-releasing system ATP-binding protein